MRRALLLTAWIACAACAGCTEPAARAAAAVVYGVDGRTEVYAHPSPELRAVAESAIAMKVSTRLLDEDDPSDVRFDYSRTLGEARSLCPGQPFADQIEPGTCSGTLIDERLLLTAGHCMSAASDCTDSAWVFGFRYVASDTLATLRADDVYRCARVVAHFNDGFVDHAVVELDRPVVGRAPVTMRIEPAGLALGTPLALIGHPNGIPMKIDSGGVVTTSRADATSLRATVDAFNANSGSGVFDHAGLLVALLRGGETDYVDAGGCNVVNVIDPAPTDDGEALTYVRPALEALCAVPGLVSSLCDCDGPCVPALEGDTCDDAITLEAVDQSVASTLVGYAPDVDGSCGGEGPDRVYAFDLTAPTRVTARVSGIDSVLYLRSGCAGAERACHDDIDRDTDRGSRIDLVLDAGTYRLFVDAYDADIGPLTLTLTFQEESLTPDAGPPPPVDAGAMPPTDAGEPEPPPSEGCACRATPGRTAPGGLAWLLFVLALAARRQRAGTSARTHQRVLVPAATSRRSRSTRPKAASALAASAAVSFR